MKLGTLTQETTRNPMKLLSTFYDNRLKSYDVTEKRLTENTKMSKTIDFDIFIAGSGFSVIDLVKNVYLYLLIRDNRGLTVIDLYSTSHFQRDRSLRNRELSTHREQHLVGNDENFKMWC